MIRLLVGLVVFVVAAAIGIIAAALILDDVSLGAQGFLIVVVVYAVVQAVIAPFLAKVVNRYAGAFLGGVGLIATFVALLVAHSINDALTIEGGAGTWVLATLIVWLVTAIASVLLPLILVKAGLQQARERR